MQQKTPFRRNRFQSLVAACVLFGFLVALPSAMAQQTPAESGPEQLSEVDPPPSRTELEASLEALRATEGLDEAAQSAAIDLYTQAVALATRESEAKARLAEFRKALEEAPARLDAIRDELSRPAEEPDVQPAPDATLSQLEQSLAEASARLDAARRSVSDLRAEATRRDERRAAAGAQLAAARAQLAEIDDALAAAAAESEPLYLTEARRAFQLAQRQAIVTEIAAIEAESASYEARRELLPLRRDLAQRRVQQAEQAVARWQQIVAERRQQQAREAEREARRLAREAARQDPVLRTYAEATAERAAERAAPGGLSERIDNVAIETERRRGALLDLHKRFDAIQRRIDATGLNRATGLLLRRQFDEMPAPSVVARRVAITQDELEAVQYQLIELQEERLEAGDVDGVVERLLEEINGNQDPPRADLESVARDLALARRDLLDQLVTDASTLFDRLVELNAAERETLVAVEDYRSFIEERILWVRSIATGAVPTPTQLAASLRWLLSPPSWAAAASVTADYLAARWAAALVALLALLALWLLAIRQRARLAELGDLVSRYRTDRLSHTFRALLGTILLALPLPVTLICIGWTLAQPEDQAPVALAAGDGVVAAGVVLFILELLRQTVRPRGLADAHFRWPAVSIKVLRHNLRWFTPLAVIGTVFIGAIEAHADETITASLGRVLLTVALIALSVFLYRILRPEGPVLRRFMEDNRSGWISRLRHVWAPVIIGLPLVFLVLSWLGFHYTALKLQERLALTLVLGLALVIINGLLLRWLFIARRRVAIEDARRRRDQAVAQAKAVAGKKPPAAATSRSPRTETAASPAPSSAQSKSDAPPAPIDEDKLDLPALSAQARQIFSAAVTVFVVIGLFVIWAEALPALRMLERVQIYPAVRIVEANQPAPVQLARDLQPDAPPPGRVVNPLGAEFQNQSGVSAAPSQSADAQPAHPLTLADLGIAILVLLVTLIAFRNVPGLVEIVILQRLPLDAGSRYALSTVLRYAIAIIGIAIAFNALNISWGRVQWLAAALTFGLAFGLQEIFANFVSGLIILGERPVRLGDTVTVGGVTGNITRIRMRATTVTDWDRKELIIPNKNFITGEVINWTLSDPVLRLIVPVGVSYSSDVELVERLLLEIARENATVLDDPAPRVLFTKFGDSTLDHELRVYIPHIEHLVTTYHQLRQAIVRKFREHSVEIAFPQRDLHVRSIGDLAKLVDRRTDLDGAD